MANEKSSLERELREMKAKVQWTEASRRQLEQLNKLTNEELSVYRQQQVPLVIFYICVIIMYLC